MVSTEDVLSIPRNDNLSPEELVTLDYLESRMEGSGELAFITRILHQQVAFGIVPLRAMASQLGAFTPEGIYEDGDDDDIPLIDPETNIVIDEDEEEQDEDPELPAPAEEQDTDVIRPDDTDDTSDEEQDTEALNWDDDGGGNASRDDQ